MEVKAPNKYDTKSNSLKVFLAGTIDMGKGVDWQKEITEAFEDNDDVIFLNPRRDEWDSSWKQEIGNAKFNEQVTWELDGLDNSDRIIMFIAKGSNSKVSMLELGLYANSDKMVVLCEEGFDRKGNVDIVCKRLNIKQVESIEELIDFIGDKITGRGEIKETISRWEKSRLI